MAELLDRYLKFLQDASAFEIGPDRSQAVRLELARAFTKLTHEYLALQCKYTDLKMRYNHLRQDILQDLDDGPNRNRPGSIVNFDHASDGLVEVDVNPAVVALDDESIVDDVPLDGRLDHGSLDGPGR